MHWKVSAKIFIRKGSALVKIVFHQHLIKELLISFNIRLLPTALPPPSSPSLRRQLQHFSLDEWLSSSDSKGNAEVERKKKKKKKNLLEHLWWNKIKDKPKY